MSIKVPKYLRKISKDINISGSKIAFSINCECGCDTFQLLENIPLKAKISREDEGKIRATRKWEKEVFDKFLSELKIPYRYTSKEEGEYREIKVYEWDGSIESVWEKNTDFVPLKVFRIKKGEVPLSRSEINKLCPQDRNKVFKVICSVCEKEYLLFDNRIHGNDAADFKPKGLEDYEYKILKQIDIAKINITLENYWDFENIESNGNEGLTADDYSEMFGCIKIEVVNSISAKKIKVYSEDLG